MTKRVFVSGCFDMLHSSHVEFFRQAAQYGDLDVALGSDKPVFDLNGRDVKLKSARDAINSGLSLVPEDRNKMGLVLMQNILRNISLPNLDQFSRFFRIDSNAEMHAGMPMPLEATGKPLAFLALISTLQYSRFSC